MNLEKLQKKYPSLFFKQTYIMQNKRKVWTKQELTPIITEHDSHWEIRKEQDSSPLILSKGF